MSSISFVCRAVDYLSIGEVARDAVEQAKRLGLNLAVEYRDVLLSVSPHDDPKRIREFYLEKNKERKKKKKSW